MEIRFLEIAQVEFDNAIEYYNLELPGLGDQFLLEVIDALERILNTSYRRLKWK